MIRIANAKIGEGFRTFIIAEAGVNHNGKFSLAKKLVDVAVSSGADAIKFQTFKTEEIVTEGAPKAAYQKSGVSESQFDMLKSLELTDSQFKALARYSKSKGIIFLSTPFDSQSAELLNKLGVAAFKISSGELTNYPLIRQIAKYGKPIILSTGMATLKEVEKALRAVFSIGNKKLVLLHATTNYPTEYKDVNLRAVQTMAEKFRVPVGFSDHTRDLLAACVAVGLGARVIEKHFTLSRKLAGPDHQASLEPDELQSLVKAIRDVEAILGDGVKKPRQSEKEIAKVVKKSIFAKMDIKKGTKISEKMLMIKRPEIGLAPEYFTKIIGKKALSDIKSGAPIFQKDVGKK